MTGYDDAVGEDVKTIIANAFPGREPEEIGPAGPSWNDQNETARVDFSDGETVYLKMATDNLGSRIERERAAINYVDTRCTVAVPTVITSDTSGSITYLATSAMQEENLARRWQDSTLQDQLQDVKRIGIAFAEIHSCSFERHGHIVGIEEDGLLLDTGTWTEVLIDIIDSIRERASTDRFQHFFHEVTVGLTENRDHLDYAPATLVHGDPAQPNLFHSNNTTGFIDWELAHIGDPARELNRAEKQLILNASEPMVPAFHEGYQQRAGSLPDGFEDRRPIYDVIWHLNRLSVFEKIVESADEPAEEVVDSYEENMNRLLNNIR